jgi:ribosomal protein L18E
VLGVVGLIFPVITYTSRQPVNFLGIEFTTEKQKTVLIPGIVGGLLLVGGIAVVVAGSRSSNNA